MFCPKCGNKNEDNAAFCSSCGGKLNAPQAVEAAKETSAAVTTVTSGATAGASTAVAAKKTGRTIGIIFAVVIVAAVVVTAVMTGGFGLMGPSVKDSANDYSWDELSKISAQISKASDESGAIEIAKKFNLTTADGKLDGTQIKDFQLKDGTPAQAQIAGFYHDDKTSGGKAGITFIFKDAIAEHDMNSEDTNAGGWEKSQMRAWLASDGANVLPDELKNVLIQVEKRTNNVGETDTAESVSTTSDMIWLFSFVEIVGETSISDWGRGADYNFLASIYNKEGSQYLLYRDMDVSVMDSNGVIVKHFGSAECSWWLRTPEPKSVSDFCDVGDDGDPLSVWKASEREGVVLGFCI